MISLISFLAIPPQNLDKTTTCNVVMERMAAVFVNMTIDGLSAFSDGSEFLKTKEKMKLFVAASSESISLYYFSERKFFSFLILGRSPLRFEYSCPLVPLASKTAFIGQPGAPLTDYFAQSGKSLSIDKVYGKYSSKNMWMVDADMPGPFYLFALDANRQPSYLGAWSSRPTTKQS